MRIPSQEEVEGSRADKVFNQLRDHLEQGKYRRFDSQIDRLLDTGHTPTDIASALFDLLQREKKKRGQETIAEDNEPFEERPKRKKPYKKDFRGRSDYRKKEKSPATQKQQASGALNARTKQYNCEDGYIRVHDPVRRVTA